MVLIIQIALSMRLHNLAIYFRMLTKKKSNVSASMIIESLLLLVITTHTRSNFLATIF